MVTLSKIYTRTGDSGETALGNGERRPKHDLRIAAYGTVDEINATVGIARLHAPPAMDLHLALIQNDLFDLGADLCRPESESETEADTGAGTSPLRIAQRQVDRLEAEMDDMNADLTVLRSFILPGGTPLAAYLHLARTVTRRAERLTVELAAREPVNPVAIRYLNRLSDWCFVAARVANDQGRDDVLWVPGANR